MQIEYTARKVVVTKKLKTQAEAGLERIAKMIDKSAKAHVFFSSEKYRFGAEVTIKSKVKEFVAECVSTDIETALHDALEKVEKQVLKVMKQIVTKKRHPKGEHATGGTVRMKTDETGGAIEPEPSARKAKKLALNGNGHTNGKIPMVVHSFPASASLPEPHMTRSTENVGKRPMTLEEAVKEAAFRDKDVFVFRDMVGQALVLHRRRDGKMELIEVP